jgi:hypothetical protein
MTDPVTISASIDGVEDIIVPVSLFVAVAATYALKYYFNFRSRREVQATIRAAIERGEPLTPQLLDRLAPPERPPNADLRRGLIGIGIGLALAGFGAVLGGSTLRPMAAVGALPFLVGIAYLFLWRLDTPQR